MVSLLRRFSNPPALAALVALLLYAITLNGVFIYDDLAIIEKDRRIADPRLWGEYWTDSYNFGVDNLYRPLVSMSYAIQHWVHGPKPMPFHFVNWLLHAGVSALVAAFAMRLAMRCELDAKSSRAIGFIAGVLFAVHPIHVEAVANVVGRAELMCALGVIGAMHLFLAEEPLTRGRIAAILGCFVLALLSKEQGMLVPLLLGVIAIVHTGPLSLWERVRVRADATVEKSHDCRRSTHPPTRGTGFASRTPARGRELAPSVSGDGSRSKGASQNLSAVLFVLLAVALAGYVSYRESILKFWWDKNFLDTWIQPLAAPDVTTMDRLLVPITIAGRYLQLLVAPVTLRLDYGGLIVPGRFDSGDPYFYAGLGAIALWFELFLIAVKQRDCFSLVCLLSFAFLYGLLGNIVTIIGVNMAERLMYLPSVFFVMIIARWLARIDFGIAMKLTAIVACLYAMRTFTYAARWNDRLGFYVYSASAEPRSLRSAQLALQEYLDRGDLDQAEHWANRALAILPDDEEAVLRLALVKIERGDFAEAERLINEAEQRNPVGKSSAYRQKLEERRAATRPSYK